MCATLRDAVHAEKRTMLHCNARSSLHLPHVPHAAAVAPARAQKKSVDNCTLHVRFRVVSGTPERVRQKAIEDCGKRVVPSAWRAERVHANLPQTALAHLLALEPIGQQNDTQCDSHLWYTCRLVCAACAAVLWRCRFVSVACLVAVPCGAVPEAVHTHTRGHRVKSVRYTHNKGWGRRWRCGYMHTRQHG